MNVYLLSTNQFSNSKISKVSNNMATKRRDNEIETQLHIINQWMDQMTNEFGDRLDGWRGNVLMSMVGFKLDLIEENLMLWGLLDELTLMWIRLWLIMQTQVMLILKMCLWDIGNILYSNRIFSLKGKHMMIILVRGVVISIRTIMSS
jgi:hypothetical protein